MGIRRAAIQTTADRTVSYQSGQSTNGTISSGGGTLVTSIVYTDNNYNTLTANAASTTFGTFRILGTGFTNGANVMLSNTSAGTIANVTTNTTYVGSNEIRANVSVTAGNYTLYVLNPNGSAAIYYSGVTFQPYPQWTTTSYSSSSVVYVQLLTSSTAVEQPITYALVSGTLPTGTSLSANGLISGTATGITGTGQTFTFTVSATDIYNETTQSSITLTISVADQYFNQTTLLLNGETNTGTNYIADASTNNFAVTPYGAATPNRFSPLWGNGYYGNYFAGSSGLTDYITVASSTVFSIAGVPAMFEFWFYPTASQISNSNDTIFQSYSYPNGYRLDWNGTSLTIYTVNGGTASCPFASGTYLNIWTFIQIKYTGTTITFYINGAQVGTANQTITITNAGTSSPFIFGVLAGYYTVRGYISNFRLSNVSTRTIAVPTAPFVSDGNTSLLTFQSSIFVDNSPNALAITPSGTVKVVPNQPFGALPSSVQNYGSSLFDGSTGYLSVASATAINLSSATAFTIEGWFYWTGVNGSSNFYNKDGVYNSTYASYAVQVNGSGYLNGQIGSGNGISSVQTITSSVSCPINQWAHFAFVLNSGTLYLYQNGTQVASATKTASIIDGGKALLIGYQTGQPTNNYMSGYLSNLRIVNGTAVYTSAFTPPTTPLTAIANTSLLTLQNKNGANNNVFYDDSTNNFPITRTGTPTQGTFTPFSQTGWSNYFDQATGGFLSTPNNPTQLQLGSNNFTVECWLNISTLPTSSLAVVFSVEGSGLDGVIIGINGTNTPILHPFMYLSTTGGSYTSPANPAIFTTALSLNTWYHIAYVRNGNVFSCFINGVQDATTFTLTGALSYNSGCNATVGARAANSGNYFPGYLSNVRVLNGTALYTSNFTPPTAPLTAIANTALLTCQSNRFVDNSVNNFTLTQPNGGIQVQAFSPFAPGVSYSSANNGGSMYFNGTTDYITTTSTVNIGTNNFTCEAWIYLTSTAVSSPGILSSTTNGGIQLSLYGTNGIGIASSGVSWIFYNSSSIVPLNAWTHVVWTRGGTGTNQTSIFINGTRVANGTASSNFGNYTLSVGTVNGYDFAGYISNLKFTNGTDLYGYGNTTIPIPTAPLTPTANTSLLLLGTNTGIQDATGKNDIITVGSAMTQSNTVKYGTGALYFDGSTGAITTTTKPYFAFGTNNFTVEYWVYPISWSTGPTVIDFRGTPGTVGFSDYYSTSGVPNIYKEGTGTLLTSNTAVSVNTWTHIAYVRNSNTMTIYVNGANTGGVTDTTNWVAPSNNATFGAGKGPSLFFNGYLDDLRVTNGVARYTSNFASPSSPDLTL